MKTLDKLAPIESNDLLLNRQSAIDELLKVWEECQTANWDCYGAYPVSKKTFDCACTFIQALPLEYLDSSCFDVGAEPDGSLVFDWYYNTRWTFSVSIDSESMLYYAGLFNTDDVKGRELFCDNNISELILTLIKKVYEPNNINLQLY